MSETISLPTNVQVGNILTTNQGIAEQVGGVGGAAQAMIPIFREQARYLKAIADSQGALAHIAVTAETLDGVDVTGQTVFLDVWDGASGAWEVADSRAYDGEQVGFALPYGERYRVRITDRLTTRADGLYDHFAPSVHEGVANADATITLTYLDPESISTLTEFHACEEAIKAQYGTDEEVIAAGLEFLLGVECADTWVSDNGTTTLSAPLVCMDFGHCEDEGGNDAILATMVRKLATENSVAFDERNQEVATEATAQPGINYYAWDPGDAVTTPTECARPFDPAADYDANSFCIHAGPAGVQRLYKCAAAVSAGDWDPGEWAPALYDAAAATNYLAKLNLSEGDEIPYASHLAVFRTSLDASDNYVKLVIRYGHNNWGASAGRQYYNSAGGKGEWWGQQHAGQVEPANLETVRGYMAGCSAELLSLAKRTKVPCRANNITDAAQGAYTTTDTFFLLSASEVCGNGNANEGTALPFMVRYIVEALEDDGLAVRDYDPSAAGESGVVYVDRAAGQFYTYNPDTGAYSNVSNNYEPVNAYRRHFFLNRAGGRTNSRLRSANLANTELVRYVTSDGSVSSGIGARIVFVSHPACRI